MENKNEKKYSLGDKIFLGVMGPIMALSLIGGVSVAMDECSRVIRGDIPIEYNHEPKCQFSYENPKDYERKVDDATTFSDLEYKIR